MISYVRKDSVEGVRGAGDVCLLAFRLYSVMLQGWLCCASSSHNFVEFELAGAQLVMVLIIYSFSGRSLSY